MSDLEDSITLTDADAEQELTLESDTDVPTEKTVVVEIPTDQVADKVETVINFEAEREEIINQIGFGD